MTMLEKHVATNQNIRARTLTATKVAKTSPVLIHYITFCLICLLTLSPRHSRLQRRQSQSRMPLDDSLDVTRQSGNVVVLIRSQAAKDFLRNVFRARLDCPEQPVQLVSLLLQFCVTAVQRRPLVFAFARDVDAFLAVFAAAGAFRPLTGDVRLAWMLEGFVCFEILP